MSIMTCEHCQNTRDESEFCEFTGRCFDCCTCQDEYEEEQIIPVLGKTKRVLTVPLSEIDSAFYEDNESFFDDEEGYLLTKEKVPSNIMTMLESIVDNHLQLDKATHIMFIDD